MNNQPKGIEYGVGGEKLKGEQIQGDIMRRIMKWDHARYKATLMRKTLKM